MTAEATKEGARAPSTFYRWVVLFVISLPMFGNYYIYDSVIPVNPILLKLSGEFTNVRIGWFPSAYSISAPFMLLLGVFLVDRMGTRKSMAFFSALCLLASVLMVIRESFWYMLAGRAVLGLGAEMLIVTVTTSMAKWFKGKELGFAFGINLAMARLGQIAAENAPTWAPGVFRPTGPEGPASWRGPLFMAVGAGALCVLGAVLYWWLEVRAEKRYVLGVRGAVDRLELSHILNFGRSYWWIVGLCVAFYSGIFPFQNVAVDFFMNTRLAGMSENSAHKLASFMSSGLPIAAMIATPLFGLLVDKVGRRALFMTVGSIVLMPVYLIMMYAPISLWVPVAMMGTAFSLVPAVMWPAVAYIVDPKRLGSAYALMNLIQQGGLFVMPQLVGYANDYYRAGAENPAGYAPGMWIFSVVGVIGLFFAVLLWREDSRRKPARPHVARTMGPGLDA